MQQNSRSEVVLDHPSGCKVMLVGTHHVAATAGNQTAAAVKELSPSRVLLELDEARFQQLNFRLRHLLHGDTASLMDLAAADDPSSSSWGLRALLPDALLWGTHMREWALLRNEGVPLLLGSLYGADFLQAALAASALPQQASLVLADQPQHLTLSRFAALTDTLGALRHLLGGLFGTAHAEAHHHPYSAHHQHHQQQQLQVMLPAALSSTNSTTTIGPLEALQQLSNIFTAAAQLAAGRMLHLCLSWRSMALTSQARWYGDNLHPVFLLVRDPALQRKLTARGCEGVSDAAAAAGRLLEVASAAAAASASGSSSSSSSAGRTVLPAEEDLLAVRRFVASLESVMRSDAGTAAAASNNGSSDSSSSRQGVVHWLEADPHSSSSTTAGCEQEAPGLGELLLLRPWWVSLSENFNSKLAQLGSSSSADAAAAAGSSGLASALQNHRHANVTAAAAYDRAVMAERNAVLVSAMWLAASAAAAEDAEETRSLSQQQQQQPGHAGVVAVVGHNHLPGIVQLWRQLQQHHDAEQQFAHGTTTSSSGGGSEAVGAGVYPLAAAGGQDGAFLPWQVTLTDAVAGVLELAAAGGAGLCYLAGVNRWAPAGAAAAAAAAAGSSGSSAGGGFARLATRAAASGPGLRRLGLLLLPAAVALLPLQRDAKRVQEAGGLLSRVAVVNDVILRREAGELGQGSDKDGSSSIRQLALRAGARA